MMKIQIPPKLQRGDEVRVIAPARSMSIISEQTRAIAAKRFEDLGLKLTFGKNVFLKDRWHSSPLAARLDDLHTAVADPKVKAILTVIGGYNTNDLLTHIDWNLIKRNPKIFCGYCDFTTLALPLLVRSNLVSYYGPHYSSFGEKKYFDYTLNYFLKAVMSTKPYLVEPAQYWSNDLWYLDQDKRKRKKNSGWKIIQTGIAEGQLVGGNIQKIALLMGTKYLPGFRDKIVLLQEAGDFTPPQVEQHFQAILNASVLDGCRALLLGRFEPAGGMTMPILQTMLHKIDRGDIPIVANLDFGHTDPKFTWPIGGTAKLIISRKRCRLKIIKH